MMRNALAGLVLLLLGGCAAAPVAPASTAPAAPSPPARTFHVGTDGVAANLYLPPNATAGSRTRAILFFGGSEGGIREPDAALALAGRGFVVLELGYFAVPDEPRLPTTLTRIPIEYFATAARLLAAQPEADPAHIAVWGGSRGSEAAALVAATYPDLVHGAVLSSPSSVVHAGYPDPRQPAWTLHGTPLPAVPPGDPITDAPNALLPVDKIAGPVVTICGGLDTIWHSCDYSAVIARHAHVTALSYPDAGHAAVELGAKLAAGGSVSDFPGGSPAADLAAAQDALPRITALLDEA